MVVVHWNKYRRAPHLPPEGPHYLLAWEVGIITLIITFHLYCTIEHVHIDYAFNFSGRNAVSFDINYYLCIDLTLLSRDKWGNSFQIRSIFTDLSFNVSPFTIKVVKTSAH